MSLLDLPHMGFVIAAYAITFVVVLLLVAWVVRDHQLLRRALAAHGPKGANLSELEAEPR